MPAARAISSTTLSRRRSAGSCVCGSILRAPSNTATAWPPEASCAVLYRLLSRITASVPAATMRNNSGCQNEPAYALGSPGLASYPATSIMPNQTTR